jgi:hypothetical protein
VNQLCVLPLFEVHILLIYLAHDSHLSKMLLSLLLKVREEKKDREGAGQIVNLTRCLLTFTSREH